MCDDMKELNIQLVDSKKGCQTNLIMAKTIVSTYLKHKILRFNLLIINDTFISYCNKVLQLFKYCFLEPWALSCVSEDIK